MMKPRLLAGRTYTGWSEYFSLHGVRLSSKTIKTRWFTRPKHLNEQQFILWMLDLYFGQDCVCGGKPKLWSVPDYGYDVRCSRCMRRSSDYEIADKRHTRKPTRKVAVNFWNKLQNEESN